MKKSAFFNADFFVSPDGEKMKYSMSKAMRMYTINRPLAENETRLEDFEMGG